MASRAPSALDLNCLFSARAVLFLLQGVELGLDRLLVVLQARLEGPLLRELPLGLGDALAHLLEPRLMGLLLTRKLHMAVGEAEGETHHEPKAPARIFFTSLLLEPVVQVDKERVDGEGRALDLIGRRPFEGGPEVLAYPEVASDDPALGVRPAQVEIGIGEGVDHRVRLEVLVISVNPPIPPGLDLRVAHGQAGQVPLVWVGTSGMPVRRSTDCRSKPRLFT